MFVFKVFLLFYFRNNYKVINIYVQTLVCTLDKEFIEHLDYLVPLINQVLAKI